jgi:hypothetical protein
MFHTNGSGSVVRETLAQFHKGNGVRRPGNFVGDTTKRSQLLISRIDPIESLIIGSNGSVGHSHWVQLLIQTNIMGGGVGLGHFGQIEGIGGIHRDDFVGSDL